MRVIKSTKWVYNQVKDSYCIRCILSVEVSTNLKSRNAVKYDQIV